jgi:hypothetical protein
MKTIYGGEIKYIKIVRFLYEIPNYGQVHRAYQHERFHQYALLDAVGVESGLRIDLSEQNAKTFADINGLSWDVPEHKASTEPWPEETIVKVEDTGFDDFRREGGEFGQ